MCCGYARGAKGSQPGIQSTRDVQQTIICAISLMVLECRNRVWACSSIESSSVVVRRTHTHTHTHTRAHTSTQLFVMTQIHVSPQPSTDACPPPTRVSEWNQQEPATRIVLSLGAHTQTVCCRNPRLCTCKSFWNIRTDAGTSECCCSCVLFSPR